MWFLFFAGAAALVLYLVRSPVTETLGSVPGSIIALANAIKLFEGWYPGSRSYKNNNPGNLKDADGRLIPEKDWADDWGAYKLDDKNFYVFDTAEHGSDALVHLLQVRVGQHPEWSILDLFFSYAPPSENDTKAYAAFVAKHIGGDVTTKLGELV
jgi:hypothetical protein